MAAVMTTLPTPISSGHRDLLALGEVDVGDGDEFGVQEPLEHHRALERVEADEAHRVRDEQTNPASTHATSRTRFTIRQIGANSGIEMLAFTEAPEGPNQIHPKRTRQKQ
ncbi:hypothetical protein ACIP5U_39095 [Streptomyces sp. NPDC088788]|uniref:hypothetical protein n=1 Tax=Streptomyces sp. NPDC088788 TaxID=3365898 RepID=UPI0038294B46